MNITFPKRRLIEYPGFYLMKSSRLVTKIYFAINEIALPRRNILLSAKRMYLRNILCE